MCARTKLNNIYRNAKRYSTQQGKIQITWHLIKNDQTCKEIGKYGEKSIKLDGALTQMLELADDGSKPVIITLLNMLAMLETQKI